MLARSALRENRRWLYPALPAPLLPTPSCCSTAKDLSKWRNEKGQEARWRRAGWFRGGYGTGNISPPRNRRYQLHLEWASPAEVKGESQDAATAVCILWVAFEIQVLDSYQNKTYPNGQAGAYYGNAAPLVNASRKPGEWQVYDIIFRAPKKRADGSVEAAP